MSSGRAGRTSPPVGAGSVRVVCALAVAGLRHRLLLWVLLAAGIAAAGALPVVARALQGDARAAAVRSAIDDISVGQRSVVAVEGSTLSRNDAAALDQTWTAGARSLGLGPPLRVLVFHALTVAGRNFALGGSDRLTDEVALTSGRLPGPCSPTRCEVVMALPAGLRAPAADAYSNVQHQLGLVITGTATLTDVRLAGGGLVDGDTPVLLAASVEAVAALQTLQLFGRTTAWLADLDSATVLHDSPGTFAGRLADLTGRVNVAFPSVVVQWPSGQVQAAIDRTAATGGRFGVFGAVGAALQLGFALVTAVALRRRQQLVNRLLLRRGAGTAQILGVPTVQIVLTVGTGVLFGAGSGLIAAAAVSGQVSGGRVRAAGTALSGAWPSILGVAAAALVVVVAVVLWSEQAGRSTRAALDVVLIMLAGAAVLILRSGPAAGDLAVAVTTIVALATGLVAARCWPWLSALLARIEGGRAAGRSVVWPLSVLAGLRRGLLPSTTTGFAAAAICTLMFAGGFRATLAASAQDQGAFQVPLDVRVSASPAALTPGTVLNPERLRTIDPNIVVEPVVSAAATAFPGSDRAVGLPVVGLDGGAFTAMHDFGAVTGSNRSAAELGGLLDSPRTALAAADLIIPAGTRTLTAAVSGLDQNITLTLWAVDATGVEHQVELVPTAAGARATVGNPGPWRVLALEIAESSYSLVHRQHTTGEGTGDLPLPSGTVVIGSVTADGAPLSWNWTSWGGDRVGVTGTGTGISVRFQIGDARLVAVPGFLRKDQLPALAVLADPDTAALVGAGAVTVGLNDLTIAVRIVAVLPRLPTYGNHFLVADRTALAGLIDRTQPGTAPVDQFWVAVPDAAMVAARAYLASPPVSSATVTFRADVAARLADDPVNTRSSALLVAAGVLALALALIAVLVAVSAARQDESGENYSWELDGLGPRALRRILVVRAALILIPAAAVGAAGGVVLTRTAGRLIAVGGAGVVPVPPLQAVLAVGPTLELVGAALATGLLAALVAAAISFREPAPQLLELDLR